MHTDTIFRYQNRLKSLLSLHQHFYCWLQLVGLHSALSRMASTPTLHYDEDNTYVQALHQFKDVLNANCDYYCSGSLHKDAPHHTSNINSRMSDIFLSKGGFPVGTCICIGQSLKLNKYLLVLPPSTPCNTDDTLKVLPSVSSAVLESTCMWVKVHIIPPTCAS